MISWRELFLLKRLRGWSAKPEKKRKWSESGQGENGKAQMGEGQPPVAESVPSVEEKTEEEVVVAGTGTKAARKNSGDNRTRNRDS